MLEKKLKLTKDMQTPLPQFGCRFNERCAKCWIEWNINFTIFPIFIFWVIVDFVHNFRMNRLKNKFFNSPGLKNLYRPRGWRISEGPLAQYNTAVMFEGFQGVGFISYHVLLLNYNKVIRQHSSPSPLKFLHTPPSPPLLLPCLTRTRVGGNHHHHKLK